MSHISSEDDAEPARGSRRVVLLIFAAYYAIALLVNGTVTAGNNLVALAIGGVHASGHVTEVARRTHRWSLQSRYYATIEFSDQESIYRSARIRMTSSNAANLKRGTKVDLLYMPGNEGVGALSMGQAASIVIAGLLWPIINLLFVAAISFVILWRKTDDE